MSPDIRARVNALARDLGGLDELRAAALYLLLESDLEAEQVDNPTATLSDIVEWKNRK